jgi:hypothetical protein
MTSYEKVYGRFLNHMTDFNLADLDDHTLNEMLKDWLHSAIVKTRASSDLARDDENEVFKNDLSDLDIELLAMGMRLAWLDQRINSTEYTNLFVGGKEEKLKHLFAFSSLHKETLQCISLNCWKPLRVLRTTT